VLRSAEIGGRKEKVRSTGFNRKLGNRRDVSGKKKSVRVGVTRALAG